MTVALAALGASLVGSPHCLGMCGGLACAGGPDRAGALAWNLGRGTAYAALGALAGGAGMALPGGDLARIVAVVLLAWCAAGMAGLVPEPRLPRFPVGGLLHRGLGGRFLFGAVTALLPCGLLWSGLALALSTGDAVHGAAVALALWVGTLPALAFAGVALARIARLGPVARRLVAVVVLLAGVGAVWARSPSVEHTPDCHEEP